MTNDYRLNSQIINPLPADSKLINSPYTTNRILEIPQDIKLELKDGTLTLKAGSKVYQLDGTSITITSDATLSTSYYGFNQQSLIYYSPDSNSLEHPNKYICFSGNGYPTITEYQYMLYFDVTNKKYYWTSDNGSSWTERTSATYPIAIATVGDSNWTSIDQVFNGFGYIGSTVFALTGVKGEIPNGRNEDGTCKNVPFTTEKIYVSTITENWTGWFHFVCRLVSSILYFGVNNAITWDSENNYWYYNEDPSYKDYFAMADLYITSGKITSWKPLNVDSVANSNMSNISSAGRSYLSGIGMPSNRVIDLTLGSSGSTYTAPANGYVLFGKAGTDAGQVLQIEVNGRVLSNLPCAYAGHIPIAFVPMSKGTVFKANYTVAGDTNSFKFIYAEGEN